MIVWWCECGGACVSLNVCVCLSASLSQPPALVAKDCFFRFQYVFLVPFSIRFFSAHKKNWKKTKTVFSTFFFLLWVVIDLQSAARQKGQQSSTSVLNCSACPSMCGLLVFINKRPAQGISRAAFQYWIALLVRRWADGFVLLVSCVFSTFSNRCHYAVFSPCPFS